MNADIELFTPVTIMVEPFNTTEMYSIPFSTGISSEYIKYITNEVNNHRSKINWLADRSISIINGDPSPIYGGFSVTFTSAEDLLAYKLQFE